MLPSNFSSESMWTSFVSSYPSFISFLFFNVFSCSTQYHIDYVDAWWKHCYDSSLCVCIFCSIFWFLLKEAVMFCNHKRSIGRIINQSSRNQSSYIYRHSTFTVHSTFISINIQCNLFPFLQFKKQVTI